MKYLSTRGVVEGLTFENVLFKSYATDGGMFMPSDTPHVSIKDLQNWENFSYSKIVREVCKLFVSENEVPYDTQREIIEDAFKTFDISEVVHLAKLKNNLNILELWHGATLAFKDLAMTCTTRFLNYFLKKKKSHFTAIIVTSGDTGSSALEGARGMESIDVVVGYPFGRIDHLQELMMTTVQGEGVHVYGMDGDSDEIDNAVNKIFADDDFCQKNAVGSFNSVNWCRIMVQIAHHIYAYLQTAKVIGEPVNIVIPCGGCGNLAACMMAIKMGVPIQPTCCVNNNVTLHDIISCNNFKLSEAIVTVAPSMDIAFPYNIERVLWLLSDKNGKVIKQIMEDYKTQGHVRLPEDLHKKLSSLCNSFVADNDLIVKTMQRCFNENQYHVCPHTATAVAYVYQRDSAVSIPTVCIATASLAKFSKVCVESGLPTMQSARIDDMLHLDSRYVKVERAEDWTEIIRSKVLEITKRRASVEI